MSRPESVQGIPTGVRNGIDLTRNTAETGKNVSGRIVSVPTYTTSTTSQSSTFTSTALDVEIQRVISRGCEPSI